MPSETLTTAAAAQRRLAALDAYMTGLQNAAIGRGLKPAVSEALANVVAQTWQAYRTWRDTLGGVTLVWSYVSELEEWTKRANKLRAAIALEGVATPAPLDEWTQTGPVAVAQAAAGLAQGIGMVAAGLAIAYLVSQRRR